MKHRKVISRRQLPTKLPIGWTIIVWLLLDRLDVQGWVWGAVGTLFGIYWIVAVQLLIQQKEVELKEVKDGSADNG